MITLPRKFTLRTLLLGVAACAAIAFVYRLVPPMPSTLMQLRRGMSREEVRAILGEPDAIRYSGSERWTYGVAEVVEFDDEGKLLDSYWY